MSDLSTQQAADILGVSRPWLIKQLQKNEIPFYLVGTHRRIVEKDLIIYRDKMRVNRRQALNELCTLGQEIENSHPTNDELWCSICGGSQCVCPDDPNDNYWDDK